MSLTPAGTVNLPADPIWRPTVEVAVAVAADIVRQARRSRCANCQRRRELYRVVVQANAGDSVTEAKCAECWGIRG